MRYRLLLVYVRNGVILQDRNNDPVVEENEKGRTYCQPERQRKGRAAGGGDVYVVRILVLVFVRMRKAPCHAPEMATCVVYCSMDSGSIC